MAGIVNPVGAQVYNDLTTELLDECLQLGISVVGCSANNPWDDTLETIENLHIVKRLVEEHPNAYILESRAQVAAASAGKVGVLLGVQNPKPFSDSLNFLEAFADMGLRCTTLALRENSYYGFGFAAAHDSGLSVIGRRAVRVLNKRGIVIDLSHGGDKTSMDAIEVSDHPVIFSHSLARTVVGKKPQGEFAGIVGGALRRAAPDELIVAAANKGGVFCPDVRLAESIDSFMDHVQYAVGLVGIDHVGVCAQDDWTRSAKEALRMQSYRPGFGALPNAGKDSQRPKVRQIYRMDDQLGPGALASDRVGAELSKRFSKCGVEKILGGNLIRVFQIVLQ